MINEWMPRWGEIMLVSSDGELWLERVFVWRNAGRYWCISHKDENGLVAWNYAKPLPKKKYIPYTFDTFPSQSVAWLRFKETNDDMVMVIGLNDIKVFTHSYSYAYKEILERMELSTDKGISWIPAGEEVDE